MMLGLAAGSLLVPLMVSIGGSRTAVLALGGLLILVPAVCARTLTRLERDAPDLGTQLSLLRGSPLFSMLAAPVLEDLARALVAERIEPGTAITREGEPGDVFYLLADGELTVTIDGAEVRRITRPGDGFGEVALLRDGIRTATVTANGPATVYALERIPFLAALTGSFHARRAADELVALHLGTGQAAGEHLRTASSVR